MKEKFPLSYKTIQQIKAQEYERFFSRQAGYSLYMNHLGEVRWLRDKDATKQHEFFHFSFSPWERLKRYFRFSKKLKLSKLHPAERELRLKIRKYLEETYLGEVKSETAGKLPPQWAYDIDEEEIQNIPVSLDFGREEIWKRLGFLALFMLIVFTGLIAWIYQTRESKSTYLMVQSSEQGVRVYADNSRFLGYANRPITNIPPGQYKITARKDGYQTFPLFHEVVLRPDSQVVINFQFKMARSELLGYLKVLAEYEDSKLFVDDIYYGQLNGQNIFELDSGIHEVSLRKDGFLIIPPERTIRIIPGDTLIYSVEEIPLPDKSQDLASSYTKNVGSIEVNSNINGASIFLNGRNTGQFTDHIFTQLPLGGYSIQLKKEGYQIEPDVQQVSLSSGIPSAVVDFKINRNSEIVEITTVPATGIIIIDGNKKGNGKFSGTLPIGDHTVSFGAIPGYVEPLPQKISVRAGFPLKLQVEYFPEVEIKAAVSDRGTIIENNCNVTQGYTFKDRAFIASSEGGPSIEFNKDLNDYFWKLGYAFPYRNPKGNDAVKISFNLPRELNYDQKFTLKLYAASSREKYPLSLSSNTEIDIKFNNNVLSYYYTPKLLEDLQGMEMKEWDITPFIKGGTNNLEISTTDKNNTFYYLKMVEIFN
jgi:hypothetical protein